MNLLDKLLEIKQGVDDFHIISQFNKDVLSSAEKLR